MERFITRTASIPSIASASNPSQPNKRPLDNITSPDQWQRPKKFIANPKNTSKHKDTTTKNRFSSLPVDEDGSESESFKIASNKRVHRDITPFVIELLGELTLDKLRITIKKYINDFHMHYRGRKIVRVQCYSNVAHKDLKEGLRKENVAFHTFPRKDEKLPKAVIKGLPKFAQDNIVEELNILGFPGATATELKTAHQSECPPVLVQLPNGTEMAKFKKIRYLSSCVVDIQKYKPNRKPGTQCFRCQAFGHASKYCNRPARCVKCAESHPTWECPKKDREAPARCCNCEGEHPANYIKCNARLKYLERIETKRETLRKAVTSNVSKPLETNIRKSWAHPSDNSASVSQSYKPQTTTLPVRPESQMPAVYPAIPQPNRTPAGYLNLNSESPLDLDSLEMLEILTTIRSIKQDFKKCNTFMDKVILILTNLGHYV